MSLLDKIGEPLFIKKERWYISGKWAYYFYSVYGVPVDMFEELCNKLIFENDKRP